MANDGALQAADGCRAQEILVAFDAAAGDEVCLGNLLHFERSCRRNVDMEKPPTPPFGSAAAQLCKFRHLEMSLPPVTS